MILYSPRTTCLFKQGATETFRLSSTKLFETVGSNMQNVEKSMRATYIPDGFVFKTDAEACYKWIQSNYEDYSVFTEEQLDRLKVFLQQDQSGAEALIVARLTKPGSNYRALFDNGIKPHVFIGLAFPKHWEKEHPYIHEIAKLPINQIKQHPNWSILDRAIKDSDNNLPATRYYYHYKQTCHSANYDIKAPTFQLNLLQKSGGKVILTLAQAAEYLLGYDTRFPEIKDDFHTLVAKSVERGIIYNLFGFPRIVTGQTRAIREHEMKEWYAFIPQSTVGCITHVAIKKQRQLIEASDLHWNILNNCHDSFLMQCPIREWKVAAKSMQDSMSIELRSPYGELFKMKSECQLGFNWGPAKSCKNQTPSIEEIDKYNLLGLREIKV